MRFSSWVVIDVGLYLPRLSEAREYMFEDRTKAHADHVGHGLDRMTTAAVGECIAANVSA
ncbi:Lysine-specific demethylase rsbn1l [Homalodisca vitripennis]|nr:Lysine-specific demethylase rsbn1l [Homalodisca vitripennis]